MIYKHAKVTTKTPKKDGSTLIETKSYHEQLSNVEQITEQSIKTTKATFVEDLMKCIRPISDGTTKSITLKIEANDQKEPTRIVQTWTIHKEYYGR